MAARTIVVHGPMGCGKTTNATRLAAHFGCRQIVDDFDPNRHPIKRGALHLSHVPCHTMACENFAFADVIPHLTT